MKRLISTGVMVCAATVALGAQQPRAGNAGPGPMPGPGAMGQLGGGGAVANPAEFLLAHTGEFRLTDAQVTRLAAIARRSADRRRSLRAQVDSMRSQFTPGTRPDSATRERMRQRFAQMRPAMDRMREQSQADRRDAIAVLTPDQQAQAWERIAASGRAGRARMGRGLRGGPGRGFGGQGRAGFRNGPVPGPRMRGQGMGPRRMGPPSDDAGAAGDRRRPPPAQRPNPEQQP